MADVFLSYKRDQRAEVELLATALRGLGLDVWFDASLSAGEAFSKEIDREVRAARIVLVCWSPEAAKSDWVTAEAQVGFPDRIVSIYVSGPDGFEPPVPFNRLHVEDMRGWAARPSARDPAWLSVLRSIGRLLARPDIAEWSELGIGASVAQIETWLATHPTSPLFVDAESFLREREAIEREREALEVAARERFERLHSEKLAAEAAQRDARERIEAEKRAREAEERAAQSEKRARASRRALILGGAAVAGTSVGLLGWWGLLSDRPFLRRSFPIAQVADGARYAIRPGHQLQHLAEVHDASFSPDGKLVVTVSSVSTNSRRNLPGLRLWEVESGRELASSGYEAGTAAFSSDGQQILTTSQVDGTARLFDVSDFRQVWNSQPYGGNLVSAAFTTFGLRIAAATPDRTTIWNDSGQLVTLLHRPQERRRYDHVNCASLSADGNQIVIGYHDGKTDVWDVSSGRRTVVISSSSRSAVFSRDGQRILASGTGATRVLRAATGEQLLRLEHEGNVESASYNSEEDLIATASYSTARIWESATGRLIATLRGHGGEVSGGHMSGHGGEIRVARFNPRGDRLVTASLDGTARFWSIDGN
jgi:hypothetical protein